VCTPLTRKVGVQLRVKYLGLRYVRARDLDRWTLEAKRVRAAGA
jgi:hypothetical protein